MTKQEEIRERVASEIFGRYGGRLGDSGIGYIVAGQILSYLHSQGCRIEVNSELPSIFDVNDDIISALEYQKKLEGYVAVESLIQED